MELRELKSSDVFIMVNILKKIGFVKIKTILTPENLKEMTKTIKGETKGDDVDGTVVLGFNVIMSIVEIVMDNLQDCEQDIYKFLGSLSGLKPKEVADIGIADFAQMIVDVLQKPEFGDFFKVVSKLFS